MKKDMIDKFGSRDVEKGFNVVWKSQIYYKKNNKKLVLVQHYTETTIYNLKAQKPVSYTHLDVYKRQIICLSYDGGRFSADAAIIEVTRYCICSSLYKTLERLSSTLYTIQYLACIITSSCDCSLINLRKELWYLATYLELVNTVNKFYCLCRHRHAHFVCTYIEEEEHEYVFRKKTTISIH